MNIKDELYSGKNIYDLPLRVTYYARVSTDFDNQVSSINNQVDYFKKMINNNDCWIMVDGYVDYGISGKAIKNRVSFLKMIKDGISGNFDLVLTKSVSRFARNTIDSIRYTDLLKSRGIGVFFVNDNINTFYNDSEFRLTLMASIAQDEIRKLSESVKFGLNQSVSRGNVLGNSNILGYKKNKGQLVILEEEAVIVRKIFSLFVTNNYSYRKIAMMINCEYDKNFDSTSIKRILTNYKYKGYYCGGKSVVIDYKNNIRKNNDMDKWIIYKDYKNVPPIVLEKVWDCCNDIINKRKRKRNNKVNSLYEGKVFCMVHNQKCRYVFKKYKDKHYGYFVCSCGCSVSEIIVKKICRNLDVKFISLCKKDDYVEIRVNVHKV